MFEFNREEHSRRTYRAAKRYILDDPLDPFGKGLVQQLITETASAQYKVLGISLLVLLNTLRKNPDQIETVRDILKKQ